MSAVSGLVPGRPIGSVPSLLPCTVCCTESQFQDGFADIRLFRCPSCKHCFTDFSSLEEEEQYGPEYFQEVHKNWFEHPDLRLFEQIYGMIVGNRPGASVLDIGCGKGNLLRYLRRRDPELQLAGIDVAANDSGDGIEFLHGDFLTWKFDRKFDAVVSLQVIEHMTDPRIFAQRASELCREGSLVIVSTVNEQSLVYDIGRLAARFLGSKHIYERLYSRHHLNHFNISSLRRLFEGTGMKVKKHFRHEVPIAAMDIPAPNKPAELILRAGVWGCFALGDLTGRTMYQTIVCLK